MHGYTASQTIVDGPSKKDWKEGAKDGATTALLAYAKACAAWGAQKLDLKESFEAAQNNPLTNWLAYTIAFSITRTAFATRC